MIILIEGPDGSGKSTLARKLADHFKAPMHHSARPLTGVQLRENMDYICELDARHDLVVIDRAGWVSEFIYSRAMFRDQMLSTYELLHYHNRAQIVIYCTADDYNIVEGKEHKPPEYMERLRESHDRVVSEYENFFSYPRRFTLLRYNYQSDDFSSFLKELNECVDLLR
jgi:thymidylate kinase